MVHLWYNKGQLMDRVALRQKIKGRNMNIDSIKSDMTALPPKKTLEDKYYVGYFDDAGNLIAVMDFIDKYPDERTAFIGFFMVNADFQGRGIGSFLISELFQYLNRGGDE